MSKGVGFHGYSRTVTGKIVPIRDNVLAWKMNFEERKTLGGIVLLSDDGETEGVRHRWCQVWAVGPDQTEVQVGDWLLIEHGRWTRGIKVQDENGDEIVIRRIDTNAILMVSDEDPGDNTYGSHTRNQGQTFTPDMFAR